MKKTELQNFEQSLAETFETYDKRQPSAVAIKNWFEALQFFSLERIQQELKSWITTKNKPPTISDIYQPLNEKSIDDRENKWAATKAQEKKDVEELYKGNTQDGRLILKTLLEFLGKTKNSAPKEWEDGILDAYHDDDCLRYTNPIKGEKLPINGRKITWFQVKMACEGLGLDFRAVWKGESQNQKMREPGEEG